MEKNWMLNASTHLWFDGKRDLNDLERVKQKRPMSANNHLHSDKKAAPLSSASFFCL